MAYSILSLDGGGSWAIIQARVLQDIYGDIRGHELLKKFDLVIANSGGSLVLAALCHNMKLSEVIGVFRNGKDREKVFSELTFWEKLTRRNFLSFFRKTLGIGPKYSTFRKLDGLIAVLKTFDDPDKKNDDPALIANMPLDALPKLIGKESLQILIASFDYFRQRATFFRSNAASNTDRFSRGAYYRVTLAHAVHASSNAPVNYFDKPAAIPSTLHSEKETEHRTGWYWDGAVAGFNNPVLAGFIEALTNNAGRSMDDYKILSLGTGLARKAVVTGYQYSDKKDKQEIYHLNKTNPLVVSDASFRFLDDVSKMAKSIVNDPPDSATFIVHAMLKPALTNDAGIIRINPCLSPELNAEKIYAVPDVYKTEAGREKFRALMNLDMDAVTNEEVALIDDLCDKFITEKKPCLPNQLIRGDSTEENNFLGQATYKEAKEQWLRLAPFDNIVAKNFLE